MIQGKVLTKRVLESLGGFGLGMPCEGSLKVLFESRSLEGFQRGGLMIMKVRQGE